jgi:hypothetical protein
MRFSIMAGWFYSVLRVVGGEVKSNTKRHANRDVARDLDCAEFNSQTLAPECRTSQNAVKIPVDIGVLNSLRLNWVLRVLQNLSRLVARMIVARKEQRVFRGMGGVVGNEPGMRFTPSGLRLLLPWEKGFNLILLNRSIKRCYQANQLFMYVSVANFLHRFLSLKIGRSRPQRRPLNRV